VSSAPSLLAELKRRHVYKVGAMYAVAGWLLVQIVTQVLPVFNVSALGQRILVLIVVAGFPVALVLAWLFDVTPGGIVRTGELPVGDQTAVAVRAQRGIERKLNYLLGVLLVLALGYQVLQRRLPHELAPSGAANDKSVAVLPFENLSHDPDNAYFAEGMQDQVLTQLAKIGALRVISRTSTQQYASRPPALGEIARQLGVANILEGSVQKAGNAVRINVQLIRVEGESHVWAETYDRSLDNVFGVESEVAEAIAQALDARLSGQEKQELAQRPTNDSRAWDAYLHAEVLYQRGESLANALEAERALLDAVRFDPAFAQAWALLAEIRAAANIENWDTSAEGRAAALQALQQAVRLQPDAVETQTAQAFYHFWVERDYAAARRDLERVRQRAPGAAEIAAALGFVSRRQGRWDESLAGFDQAIALDPRNIEYLCQAGLTATGMQRYPLAANYLDRCLDVSPQEASTLALKALMYQLQGQLDAADPLLARVVADPSDVPTISVLAFQKLLRRRYAEGIPLLQPFLQRLDDSRRRERAFLGFQLGDFQRLSGDAAAARASYLRARDDAAVVLVLQPANADLLDLQALIAARLGDPSAALNLVRRAQQTLPVGGDTLAAAAVQDTLARVQAAAGQQDAAIELLAQQLSAPVVNDPLVKPLITRATLQLDPDWDGLRQAPGFRGLIGTSGADQVTRP
jgi:TolB-like protein